MSRSLSKRQDLCATILGEILGQTIEVFLPSKDAGRDGAFYGLWKPGDATFSGSFTLQCKFTTKSNASLSAAGLKDELHKAKRLGANGLANNYILMTNFGVSGRTEEALRAAFINCEGITTFHVFGRDWITSKIRESHRLRMLVPRVYGLGDLSQILDERQYLQAQEILSAMGEDLSKLVVTQAYQRSARAISAQQQITNAQTYIAIGEASSGAAGSGLPGGGSGLAFFGGMAGYYFAVHTGGPNDIKDLPGHSRKNPIDVDAGNISFGITCPYGAAFCQFAAGFAQTMSGHPDFKGTLATGFDTPADNAGIRIGQAMRAAGCHE